MDYLKQAKTGEKHRHRYFIFMLIINIVTAICFLIQMSKANDSIVSNYLLFIFGVNTAGYATYYAIMKCYYVYGLKRPSESISWTCWIYIILCVIFGAIGLTFFIFYQEKSTEVSPSESRHLNHECAFWFFDKHDIWHFASAFGILFAFMALLTLEDNNTRTPWNEIPVF